MISSFLVTTFLLGAGSVVSAPPIESGTIFPSREEISFRGADSEEIEATVVHEWTVADPERRARLTADVRGTFVILDSYYDPRPGRFVHRLASGDSWWLEWTMTMSSSRGYLEIEELAQRLKDGSIRAVEHRARTSDGVDLTAVETEERPFAEHDEVSALLAALSEQQPEATFFPPRPELLSTLSVVKRGIANHRGLREWEALVELADEILSLRDGHRPAGNGRSQ